MFVPVAFMKGIVGKFFYEFGVTVAVAVLISLFVSLTLTPMLSSRFLRHMKKHGKMYLFLERGYEKLFDVYRPLLAWALRHRPTVILVAFLSIAAGFAVFRWGLGKEFLPAEDQGRYMVRLKTPVEYSLPMAVEAMSKIDARLRERPEVSSTFYVTGSEFAQDVNKSRIFVNP